MRNYNKLTAIVAGTVMALGATACAEAPRVSASGPAVPGTTDPTPSASKVEKMSTHDVFNAPLDQLLPKTSQELYPLPDALQPNSLVRNPDTIYANFEVKASEGSKQEQAKKYIEDIYNRYNSINRLPSSDDDKEAARKGQTNITARKQNLLTAWRGMNGYDDGAQPKKGLIKNFENMYNREWFSALNSTPAFPTANVQIPDLETTQIKYNSDGTFTALVPERFIAKFDNEIVKTMTGGDLTPWNTIDVKQIREFKNCGIKKGTDIMTCQSSDVPDSNSN